MQEYKAMSILLSGSSDLRLRPIGSLLKEVKCELDFKFRFLNKTNSWKGKKNIQIEKLNNKDYKHDF